MIWYFARTGVPVWSTLSPTVAGKPRDRELLKARNQEWKNVDGEREPCWRPIFASRRWVGPEIGGRLSHLTLSAEWIFSYGKWKELIFCRWWWCRGAKSLEAYRYKLIEVGITGWPQFECIEANIVKRFVVETECHITVFDKLVSGKYCIVGLHYNFRYLQDKIEFRLRDTIYHKVNWKNLL